ncbi:MAG: hypothetical protein N4J56_002885 [Chroococcidiopsis sp. SAG 2025]|uniref:hypothetical protein n=1 Tax=Chroococcidiopsis sp. SAG 2025 TaxID=171389 RepID=UPI0029370AB7|nr:hypothetical protein [Chroococcidiopsis sp. SAG 2025]MDV2993231.1 hypothetical protein [Chroococcidiopsis sp. SAG 2025]
MGEFPEGIFSSGIFNNVGSDGTGKAGNINIRTGSLSLSDRAVLNVSNFGQGDAETIFVQADSSISLLNSNIFSNVSGGAVGNGGVVNISAGSLSLIDGSQIVAAVGDGLDSLSGGRGNGGNVNIDVRNFFSADGTNGDGLSSGVFTSVGSGAVGKGGNVDIRASSLYFTNGAFIFASTFGQGNAGDVTINVRDGITFAGFNSYGFSAGIFSTVETGGVGNGGDINLRSGSLSLTDGAQIGASTFGQGNAGNVALDVSDTISLQGSSSDGFSVEFSVL